MKISQMQAIANGRNNAIGFLHISDIKAINQNLVDFDCNHKPFDEICQETLAQYKSKKISNKQASFVFEILANENKDFKTERYRYERQTNKLYVYSEAHRGYLFDRYCTAKEYKELVTKNGMYI